MFRRRRGEVRVSLNPEEADLLRRLVREYLDLLDSESEHDDPVQARLFPAASLDDPEVDREFRTLSYPDLEEHKRRTAAVALESLGEAGPVRRGLTDEEREDWLVLLTDLRLALGVRLGVTEETWEAPIDPRDPAQWPLAVLHYLGALQDSLVRVSIG